MRDLIESEADINLTCDDWSFLLTYAAGKGHTEVTKCLVEAGANINLQLGNGKTALMFATEGGHIETVKCLTEAEADIKDLLSKFFCVI